MWVMGGREEHVFKHSRQVLLRLADIDRIAAHAATSRDYKPHIALPEFMS
jgi:hypothetical protein